MLFLSDRRGSFSPKPLHYLIHSISTNSLQNHSNFEGMAL